MKVSKISCTLILSLTVALAQTVNLSVNDSRLSPRLLNYQGYLTDDQGIPVTNPSLSMTFSIYDAVSAGNQKWTETQTSVDVNKGVFSVLLGSVTPIPDTVFTVGSDRWLELTVGGQTLSPRTRITSVGYAYTSTYSDTALYAHGAPADNDWTLSSNVLYPSGDYGLSMRTGNVTWGSYRNTHVNFGVACTTGRSTSGESYCTVSGGRYNAATFDYTTVAGGYANTASNWYSTVGGGTNNLASAHTATVCGGEANTAVDYGTLVCGGNDNHATNTFSAVLGGQLNLANGINSAIVGTCDTASGSYSFTANDYSMVPAEYWSSSAFNGMHATASCQTIVGYIAKAGGTFTIDHPLDPENKILNHYFVESPEMVLIYRGSTVIAENGLVVIYLPDYFDALNKNPMVQLTGVKSNEVWVQEEVSNNSFVIGGKPGVKVFWTVTGDRKDMGAEIARIFMPVEQKKEGTLAGRSLDDALLVNAMHQLERMGHGDKFQFRTAAGRQRYENMKRMTAAIH